MSDLFADRLPPQNIEAEQAVLGAIFLEPSSLTVASEILIPEDFYRAAHQKIFNVMLKLNDEGKAVDLVTVSEELAAAKLLEDTGGVSYISDLAGSVPTAANIEYYARIVEEKSLLRRLIRTATSIASDGYAREDEVEALLSEAEKNIIGRCSTEKRRVHSIILKMYSFVRMTILRPCIIVWGISQELQLALRN